MTNTLTIDYKDNCWFLTVSPRGDQMGFWTLASAMSFAVNNLRASVKLTNQALVAKYRG